MRCNEQIRLSPIRLIDENNGQVGVISTDEALRRAREAGLDLVEVAPTERPPVCRIMDYGKWKYQQKKKHKTHHREQQLKEVRLSPKTDDHDKQIKVNRAREFLAQALAARDEHLASRLQLARAILRTTRAHGRPPSARASCFSSAIVADSRRGRVRSR